MRDLLHHWLKDEPTGWSMGSFGAICEFIRLDGDPPAEAADRGIGTFTARGGLRFDRVEGVQALAWEMPSTKSERWFRHVEFLLPEAEARRPARRGFHELGRDEGAIRPEDRDMILFDCGLAQANVEFCIRSRDPELIAALRANEGKTAGDPENSAWPMVLARHPHRISVTAAGRCEVYQKIGGPDTDWKSPPGPHTHLLPKLLAAGRSHSANTPIPEGWLPVASLHPASPFAHADGTLREAFSHETWARYGGLMEAYRAPEVKALRLSLAEGRDSADDAGPVVDADDLPDGTALPSGRHLRHARRVWELEQRFTARP